ncbi:MAG: hypothetical protein HFE73_00335 [Firmicutes bacterium]|nr:hypothetical protein [Bacillota bacterium]
MGVRSTGPMRTAKIGSILISIALCILGVALIGAPEFSVLLLCQIDGILMIVFGAIRLTGYFSRDLYRLAFQYDGIFGVLLIALGTIMLVHAGRMMTFFCVAIGLFIMSEGLFKIRISWEARVFGIRQWWLILLLAAITSICGFILMLCPGEGSRVLTIVFGIALLLEGILNFSTVIAAVKIVRNQYPDGVDAEEVVDVEYFEERED